MRYALLLVLAAAVAAGATPADAPPSGRLPPDVRPLHYRLALEIVPERERFRGEVAIGVELSAPRATLWLNGRGLAVETAEFVDAGGAVIPARYEQVGEDGFARLTLAREVAARRGTIRIRYHAPFNRQLEGLYRVDEDGRSYAFTQMEPVSARLVFPGFDEPAFKTPFEIELTTRADYGAFANTREIGSEDLGGGLKRVRFAPTEKLPTYLIAFAVGPLDVVQWPPIPASEVRSQSLPLRGMAARGKGEKLRYALGHTAEMLELIEEYFGIAYPFDKLDLVAAPDFAAGAMENAGLVIYRESLLLIDDDSPLSQKRRFALVHAHELAHHWFGNLVTMPWWDDIWLNEAFATWMAYKVVDAWQPAYHFDRIGLERAQAAMATDSLESTRRIREPVTDIDGIENAFDAITYWKGGSVLAMFETYLGEDAFRAGVRRHMQTHAFGSADVFDLIASLETAAGPDKNVAGAFRSFLFQPGVPLVELALDCSGERTRLELSQRRYLPLGSGADAEQRWELPVCVSYGVDEQVREDCFMLEAPRETFALGSALTCPDWIMPNRNGAGYYRWALPEAQWTGLRRVLNARLNAREKIAYADSLVAAFLAGSLPAAALFDAVPDLAAATERPVVTAPLEILVAIGDEFLTPPNRTRAEAWAREIYGRRLARLDGAAGAESADEARLLRAELIEFLAREAGAETLRADLLRAAKAYLGNGADDGVRADALDRELLDAAMIVAGEEADAALYDRLLARFHGSTSALERRALLAGLGRVRDPTLSARSRALFMDESPRVNELPVLLAALFDSTHRDAAWSWLVANADAVIERFPPTYRGFLPRLGRGFCSHQRAAELEAVFEPRLDRMPGAPRILAQTAERIALCADLKARQGPAANRYFAALGSAAAPR